MSVTGSLNHKSTLGLEMVDETQQRVGWMGRTGLHNQRKTTSSGLDERTEKKKTIWSDYDRVKRKIGKRAKNLFTIKSKNAIKPFVVTAW